MSRDKLQVNFCFKKGLDEEAENALWQEIFEILGVFESEIGKGGDHDAAEKKESPPMVVRRDALFVNRLPG